MQIVIDIPDTEYDVLNQIGENTIPLGILLNLRDYIRFGTPLPEGHGRLIDADALEVSIYREVIKYQYINEFSPDEPVYEYTNYYKYKTIENAPTIIEADKEESEDEQ